MYNVSNIRNDFPILQRKVHDRQLIYFDNAATTHKPYQVIDSISNFYKFHNSNIHRGVHKLSQESTDMYEESHKKVGKFISAKNPFEETIFVRNTTEALNLLYYSFGMNELKKGDEVITSIMEHHSNLVPWQMLRRKGVKVKFVNVLEDGSFDIEDYEDKISKHTKFVSIVHGSNVLGTINPIKEIGKIAHDHDALFSVDGAQTAPHMKIDVSALDVDFYSFSAHKMLGPTGIGALYGKKHLLEKMEPFMLGGDMIKEVKLSQSTWNDLPWKFEAGTPNIVGGIAFGTAIDYLKKIGMDNIYRHEKSLVKHTLDNFNEIEDVKIYGPNNSAKRGGLVSFNIRNVHPHDVAGFLDTEYSIAIRSGHHCAQPLIEFFGDQSSARASYYLYNTKEEIDVFIDGIKKVKRLFQRKKGSIQ